MKSRSLQANIHATGREKMLGHLAALLFAVIIAGSFSLGAKAAPFMDPAALNAIRFSLAIGAIVLFSLVVRRRLPAAPAAPWRFAILGGLFATYFITMFMALRISPPVSTSAVFTLIPIMSAGFGLLLLGQTTRAVVLMSLLIAAAGSIWVIFRGDVRALAAFEIGRGEAIFLVGCACHAAYAPLVRLFQWGEHPLDFTFWILVGTAAVLVFFGLPHLLRTSFGEVPGIVWIAILYLTVFATAGTTFLLQFAALRLPASKVLAYGYLTPVFVILIEGMTGQGWTTISVFAGAAVTGAALVVMALGADA